MQASTPSGDADPAATPLPELLVELATLVQRALAGLADAYGPVAATALLLAALAVGVVGLPRAVRTARTAIGRRTEADPASLVLDRLTGLAPSTLQGLLLRTAQLGVLAAVAVAVLVVWGRLDLAAATRSWAIRTGPSGPRLAISLLLVALAVLAASRLRTAVAGLHRRLDPITDHQAKVAVRIGQLAVYVAAGSALLTLWNYDLSGLLVGAGFLGVVVGLAARQTLGALFAGLVVMVSRPFTVGDWIAVDGHDGRVADVTAFHTRLETPDGEHVVVPNDRVADRTVTNYSDRGRLRLRTEVGVDYDDDTDRAVEVARSAVESVDAVLDDPEPAVVPTEFGDSAVVLECRYWIGSPTPARKWRAVDAVVRAVETAFDEADLAMPFPQRTLSERSSDGTAKPGAVARESADGEDDASVRDGEGSSTNGERVGSQEDDG